ARGGPRMIIVDRLLEEREREGRPVHVAMVGAGFMGQGLANQIINSVAGMRMVAISNRNPARAEEAYRYAGVTEVDHASSSGELEDAIRRGRRSEERRVGKECRLERLRSE